MGGKPSNYKIQSNYPLCQAVRPLNAAISLNYTQNSVSILFLTENRGGFDWKHQSIILYGAMDKFLRIRLKRGWFSVGVQMTICCDKLMRPSALVGSCALSTLATKQLRSCGPCLCLILQVTLIIICVFVVNGITVPLLLNSVFLELIRSNIL